MKFFCQLLILSFSLCNSVFAHKITDAQNYLDRSDYKRAILLFSDLSKQAKHSNNITLFVSAQNGIADCYMDLGVNYKAMNILKQNITYLNQEPNKNFLLLAQTHRLLANC